MRTVSGMRSQKITNKKMSQDNAKLNERQKQYIIMKKNQIKEAVNKGNYGKARRHSVEIQQFLGNGNNEMPIEDGLEPLE